MNEIEKLYENAGVQPFKTCEFCAQKNIDCLKGNVSNITCGFSKDVYLSFTADKQLKLTKWLGKFCPVTISFSIDSWYIQIHGEQSGIDHLVVNNYFDEGVSSLINTIWQDLTKAEKQQIKEILT